MLRLKGLFKLLIITASCFCLHSCRRDSEIAPEVIFESGNGIEMSLNWTTESGTFGNTFVDLDLGLFRDGSTDAYKLSNNELLFESLILDNSSEDDTYFVRISFFDADEDRNLVNENANYFLKISSLGESNTRTYAGIIESTIEGRGYVTIVAQIVKSGDRYTVQGF